MTNHDVPEEVPIPRELYDELKRIGVIPNKIRENNIGDSNYSSFSIQSWSIWQLYNLDPYRADIIKRTLRNKSTDSPVKDIQKIKHVCDEIIRIYKNDPNFFKRYGK